MFDYLDGGADDEYTLRRNTRAFDDYELLPHYLRDIQSIDLRTRLFGTELSWPVFMSPTGMSRLFHHEAEIGVAKAARETGTLYGLSTVATTNIEDVAAVYDGPKLFQCYIHKDRSLTEELVARAAKAGYTAICLTVDTVIGGNRERDRRSGFVMPPRFTPATLLQFAARPGWAWNLLRYPQFKLANVAHRVDAASRSVISVIDYVNQEFDRTLSWADVGWLRTLWDGPLVIKGLQVPDDARRAVDAGVDAIMISNHGGRQLETTPAPVDCIADMRRAVGDDIELICDGGIRRGTHIIKALALGANAVSVGKAYLYGLGAGGQAGVLRALTLLREELERGMALLGCNAVDQLGPDFIRHRR